MNRFYNTDILKREGGKMLEMISELYTTQDQYPVQPVVEPGFLRNALPSRPPQDGQDFDKIFADTKEKIFPGLKHWNHPAFFAYYPSGSCHATVLADMFASAFNSPAFVWHASPSITELENIVMDWCVELFGLPEHYLLKNQGKLPRPAPSRAPSVLHYDDCERADIILQFDERVAFLLINANTCGLPALYK